MQSLNVTLALLVPTRTARWELVYFTVTEDVLGSRCRRISKMPSRHTSRFQGCEEADYPSRPSTLPVWSGCLFKCVMVDVAAVEMLSTVPAWTQSVFSLFTHQPLCFFPSSSSSSGVVVGCLPRNHTRLWANVANKRGPLYPERNSAEREMLHLHEWFSGELVFQGLVFNLSHWAEKHARMLWRLSSDVVLDIFIIIIIILPGQMIWEVLCCIFCRCFALGFLAVFLGGFLGCERQHGTGGESLGCCSRPENRLCFVFSETAERYVFPSPFLTFSRTSLPYFTPPLCVRRAQCLRGSLRPTNAIKLIQNDNAAPLSSIVLYVCRLVSLSME